MKNSNMAMLRSTRRSSRTSVDFEACLQVIDLGVVDRTQHGHDPRNAVAHGAPVKRRDAFPDNRELFRSQVVGEHAADFFQGRDVERQLLAAVYGHACRHQTLRLLALGVVEVQVVVGLVEQQPVHIVVGKLDGAAAEQEQHRGQRGPFCCFCRPVEHDRSIVAKPMPGQKKAGL
jgi:hypothetical protein